MPPEVKPEVLQGEQLDKKSTELGAQYASAQNATNQAISQAEAAKVDNSAQQTGVEQQAVESKVDGGPAAPEPTQQQPTSVAVGGSGPGGNAWQVGVNPLHDMASYTYSISLHVLSAYDQQQLTDNAKDWKPSVTLIGGAGRRDNRDPNFYQDFYFKDLKITSIIGSDGSTGTTNALDLSFTIIEPMGMTLLNRLVEVGSSGVGDGGNYLEIPYMIQVDFFGYNDEGLPQNLGVHTKYIPFKFTGMNMRLGLTGTEYHCNAVPFSQSGFLSEIGATPANFEITARTLRDYFDAAAGQVDAEQQFSQRSALVQRAEANLTAAQKANADKQKRGEQQQDLTAQQQQLSAAQDNLAGKGADTAYHVRSYVAAYNAWQKSMTDKKYAEQYNEIRVAFADEILQNDEIVQAQVQSARQTPMPDRGNNNNKQGGTALMRGRGFNGAGVQPQFDAGRFAVSGGTHVTEVINTAMQNSRYFRDQFIDPSTGIARDPDKIAEENQPSEVRAWKIVPSAKMNKYDNITGRWTFIITYNVVVHIKYNRKHPLAAKSFPQGWAREYEYIYTGHNRDILHWELKFDATFMTSVTADRGKNQAVTGPTPGPDQSQDLAQGKVPTETAVYDPVTKQITGKVKPGSGVNPVRINNVSDNISAGLGGNMRRDSQSGVVGSVYQSLYSESVDMLVVDVNIIGDPCFIKQDEIFYNPGNDGSLTHTSADIIAGKHQYLEDGSGTIRMDSAEVHVRMSFLSPIDIDPTTGLLVTDTKYQTMVVSGVYNVQTVESHFVDGKFEQKLTLIRLVDQEEDLARLGVAADSQRQSTALPSPQAQITAIPAVTTQISSSDLGALPQGVSTEVAGINAAKNEATAAAQGVLGDAAKVPDGLSSLDLSKLKAISSGVNGAAAKAIEDLKKVKPEPATIEVKTPPPLYDSEGNFIGYIL